MIRHASPAFVTLIWLLLAGATAVSWWFGTAPEGADLAGPSKVTGLLILAIAVVKCQLILWHFMEVSSAPRPLKLVASAWLALIGSSLSLLYAL